MSAESDIILGAKATLAQACLESGITPTEESLYWLLGLVYGESRFGQSPDWVIPNKLNTPATNPNAPEGPSHNWGACVTRNGEFIWHGDRDRNGNPTQMKFARFPTQLAGAKNFLQVINRGGAKAPIGGQGSAHDLAAAMYASGYYTGVSGSDADRINAYTNMILGGAARVRKAVGAAASEPPKGKPFVTPTDEENGFPWLLAGGISAVAIAGTVFLAHKDPSGAAARALDTITSLPHILTRRLGR